MVRSTCDELTYMDSHVTNNKKSALPAPIILIGLTLATLWAAAARFYLLHALPPPAWFDEVWYALRAREIVEGGAWPAFYFTSFGGANAGPVYMTAFSQWLGFTGITSGRILPALTGTLSIPLAYACFRELLRSETGRFTPGERRAIAALAAVVLAYTLFYVTIGRIGMENGVAPPTALFILWQMMRGLRKKWSGWALAGLTAGLAQFNGLHARFILPLVAFVGLQAFLMARPAERRRVFFGGGLMVGLTLIAALPLLLFFVEYPEWFFGRASIVTRAGPGTPYPTLADMYRFNARVILRVFSIEGSYDPKNGIPGVPLLDVIQSVGFITGLGWSIWNLPRSALARTLLFWLALMTLPSFLTEGAPNLGRMIGIAPPTAGLVSLGWVLIAGGARARLLAKKSPGKWSAALTVLAALLLTGSWAWHTVNLFVRWPEVPNLAEQFTAAPVELAEEMLARAGDEPAFVEFLPEAEDDIAAFEYLLRDSAVARMDFRKCLPLPYENETRVSYLVLSGRDLETVDKLLALYPEARTPVRDADLFQTTGTLVEVPAGAAIPLPDNAVFAQFDHGIRLLGYRLSGETFAPGETLFLTVYWHAGERVPEDLTAFTHVGTGLDAQPLVTQRDGQPCLGFYPTSQWRPGLVIEDSFAIQIPADAPPGEYDLAFGWYSYPSLTRLPLLEADHALPDDRAIGGQITVIDPAP